jgi:two-component system response regulator ChvI
VRSREQIMETVYDDHIHVLDRTIDSHVKRVRKKIRQIDPDFNGIDTLYGTGYRLRDVGGGRAEAAG